MKKYRHDLLALLLHKVTQGLSLPHSRAAAIIASWISKTCVITWTACLCSQANYTQAALYFFRVLWKLVHKEGCAMIIYLYTRMLDCWLHPQPYTKAALIISFPLPKGKEKILRSVKRTGLLFFWQLPKQIPN